MGSRTALPDRPDHVEATLYGAPCAACMLPSCAATDGKARQPHMHALQRPLATDISPLPLSAPQPLLNRLALGPERERQSRPLGDDGTDVWLNAVASQADPEV